MNLTAGAALHKGKYLLTHRSQGVFALTYRAIDTDSGQTVVIRTLCENLRQHSEFGLFKQQFLGFAERLKSCKHQNLVQVLDTFEEAGWPYIVIEYLAGQTLAQLIQTEILEEAKAIDYIYQVGDALITLHEAGLVHGDVKPQNIIRRHNSNRVVLSEFGMIGEFLPGMKQTQAEILSAGYASLEQYFQEEARTPATDIYGLAATLYTLLYRNPPLPAPVRQKLSADGGDRLFLQNSHHVTPKISQAVKRAIWRGLEIPAQKRPQTVESWLFLLQVLDNKPMPRSSLGDCLVAQPQASQETQPHPLLEKQRVKAVWLASTSSLPPTPKNKLTSLASLARFFVTKLQTLTHVRDIVAIKLNLLNAREEILSGTEQENPNGRKSRLKALLMTGAIAASAGVGFGIALRVNRPKSPGSTIFHTEQSFPPKSNWPGSERRL